MSRLWSAWHNGAPERPATSSLKVLLEGLALLTLAFLITLLLLEGGVRLVRPQDPDVYNSEKFLRLYPAPGEPQTLVPNSVGNYSGVPVRINSIGLRDREVGVPKPANVFRVLAIGDSVTFGFGVRVEESYPKRLETLLNAAGGSSTKRFEVINAGVPATGLVSYLQYLETKGPLLEPDLVLVGIVLNDIMDYDAVSAGGNSQNRHSRLRQWLSELNRALLLHSHLYLLVYMRAKSIAYQTGAADFSAAYEFDFLAVQPPSDRQERAWKSSLTRLNQLVDAARQPGVPLVLVVFPEEIQLNARELDLYRRTLRLTLDNSPLDGIPQRRLTEFARVHQVPLVDLLPRFRESHTSPLFLRNRAISHDWVHPSPAGHAAAAEEIHAALRRLELLAPSGKR